MKTFGCAVTDRLRSSRMKRAVALALAACALLLVSTCTPKTDWTKFDRETIEASVMSLNEANRMYYELKPASGKAEAARQAIDYLLTQLAVDTAGMAPDSSVWVFFTNGAVGTTFPERPDSAPGRGLRVASERPPEVAALGGGEAPGPYTVLAPFHTEFGPRDFSDEIIRMLKECLGPDVAVEDCFDEEVTVEAIRSAMGSGLLYWSGHGATVPKTRDGTDFVTGLLAGEHHGPGEFGDRAIALEAAGFWFANPPVGVPGRHLFWLADEGQIFVGILPGFVADFGRFDRPEGMTARDKCIVYISCCDASVMGPAFSAEGVDAFFGYSGSVPVLDAGVFDRDIFKLMCDTCTVGEALVQASGSVEPDFDGDPQVMIRSTLTAQLDGAGWKSRLLTAVVDDNQTVIGGSDVTTRPGAFEIAWPGQGTGTFDVSLVEDAFLNWLESGTSRAFIAKKDYLGVGGVITIGRYDDDVISGSFSGTAGYWPIGSDPEQEPPSATVEIADGRFKYSGKRFSGLIATPGGAARGKEASGD